MKPRARLVLAAVLVGGCSDDAAVAAPPDAGVASRCGALGIHYDLRESCVIGCSRERCCEPVTCDCGEGDFDVGHCNDWLGCLDAVDCDAACNAGGRAAVRACDDAAERHCEGRGPWGVDGACDGWWSAP